MLRWRWPRPCTRNPVLRTRIVSHLDFGKGGPDSRGKRMLTRDSGFETGFCRLLRRLAAWRRYRGRLSRGSSRPRPGGGSRLSLLGLLLLFLENPNWTQIGLKGGRGGCIFKAGKQKAKIHPPHVPWVQWAKPMGCWGRDELPRLRRSLLGNWTLNNDVCLNVNTILTFNICLG